MLKKNIALLAMCYNPALVSNKPLGAPASVKQVYYIPQYTAGCNSLSLPEISGPRLNIKTVLSTYGDFHVKDKTAVRTSYL